MELVKIKRAFEKKLTALLTPDLDIAYENVEFNPTVKPYAKLHLVPYDPENPTFGDSFYREQGHFLVMLYYPKNTSTTNALIKASEIRDEFPRGYSMLEDSLTIIVEGTPQIAGTIVIQDRLAVPVLIKYFANVLK